MSYASRKAAENRAYDPTTQTDADFYQAEKENDIYERQQKLTVKAVRPMRSSMSSAVKMPQSMT